MSGDYRCQVLVSQLELSRHQAERSTVVVIACRMMDVMKGRSLARTRHLTSDQAIG